MVETNEGQRQWWNDERWAEMWPKRERLTDAVTTFLLDAAALRPGERVLDVGSGGGTTSLAAA
jgi:cyclopropane fatty-acyl-phospholipid synthase-like methyltransferase